MKNTTEQAAPEAMVAMVGGRVEEGVPVATAVTVEKVVAWEVVTVVAGAEVN